eukprot:gene5330-5566_t
MKGRISRGGCQQQQQLNRCSSADPQAPITGGLVAAGHPQQQVKVKGVLTADLNTVPTVLMDHRAHLTENEFDRIVKLQDHLAQAEDRQWKAEKQHQQQKFRAMLQEQLAEKEARKEEQRQAKRAAANRAKLEAFHLQAKNAAEQKKQAEAAKRDEERRYIEQCKQAMDAAEAKRASDQEAWRAKQRAKYEQAGAAGLQKQLEDNARQLELQAAKEASAAEAKQAKQEAMRREAERQAAQHTAQQLREQMAYKAAAQQALEQQKLRERVEAVEARHALEAANKAEKAQRLSQKQLKMQQQQGELASWRQRKLEELNAPLLPADAWVHRKVLDGHERAFNHLEDGRGCDR